MSEAILTHPPEKVRTVRFRPYAKGKGPTFTLHLFDIHANDWAGRWGVGYCLKQGSRTLFECLDAKCAPFGHHTVDGDEAVKNVMGWLTLRPGDTDPGYFESYTPEQLAFCSAHAEALGFEASYRFGEE